MRCPKCGLEQPDAAECRSCGVIVSKARPSSQSRPRLAPEPPPIPAATTKPRRASSYLGYVAVIALASAWLVYRGRSETPQRTQLPPSPTLSTGSLPPAKPALPAAGRAGSLAPLPGPEPGQRMLLPTAECPVSSRGRTSTTASWPVSATWNEGARGYELAQRELDQWKAPMVVYFFTDWCHYCREFESELLHHGEVERYLRSRVVKVRVNPEDSPEDGALARSFGVEGYPSFFLTASGASPSKLSRQTSSRALKSPREFIDTIEKAAQRIAEERIREAWSLRRRGDIEGSLEAFERALALSPKNPEAYYQRAFSHLEAGSLEEAFEDLNAALALGSDRVDVYARAARALTEHERWDESVACWTKAIEANPEDALARKERARAHDSRGDRVRAIEDLADACRLGDQWSCAIVSQRSPRPQ